MTTIARLNSVERPAFVAAVGFAFENSPWIAEAAWEGRPFSGIDALLSAMMGVVRASSERRRVELIASHPDLAGKLAREGRLTASSRNEQAAAGLDRLSAEEISLFERLNAGYRARFGFPFVVCAREQTKESILAALERRAQNEREAEIETALSEIEKIARLRLQDALE
jgi:OHCU decarboxylase